MLDLADIKSILYTEKTLGLQESNVMVVKTSSKMTKNSLKEILKEYFGLKVLKINSLNQKAKVKRFRGVLGKQTNFKKFYVSLPDGAKIESLEV